MTEDERIQLQPIQVAGEKLAHAILAKEMAANLLTVIQHAQAFHRRLPEEVRQWLNESSDSKLELESLALPLAGLSGKTLDKLESEVGDLLDYFDSEQITSVGDTELKIINGFMDAAKKMGSRSKKNLQQFMSSIADGDARACILMFDGKSVEVRVRYSVSDETKHSFEL